MISEDYGGKCPNCGYTKMLIRHGSTGYYQFDACPKCGFACGSNDFDGVEKGNVVWGRILAHFAIPLKTMCYPRTRAGIFMWMESIPNDSPLPFEHIFDYTEDKGDFSSYIGDCE